MGKYADLPDRQNERGGIIMLPLRENIPEPKDKSWRLTQCPSCGAECWLSPDMEHAMQVMKQLRPLCTLCALKTEKEE